MFQIKKFGSAMAFALVSMVTSPSFALFRCEDVTESFYMVQAFIKHHENNKGGSSGGRTGGSTGAPPGFSSGRSSPRTLEFYLTSPVTNRYNIRGTESNFKPLTTKDGRPLFVEFSNDPGPKDQLHFRIFDKGTKGPGFRDLFLSLDNARKPSDLAALGMGNLQPKNLGQQGAKASILLIGEGLTGNMFSSLRDRGFENLTAIDKINDPTVLAALSKNSELAPLVTKLRQQMNENPGKIVAGDATDLKETIKNGSRQIVLAKNLFEGMDKNSVNKVLREVVRILAPGGWARLSTSDVNSLTFVNIWVAQNKAALEGLNYRVTLTSLGTSTILDIIAPKAEAGYRTGPEATSPPVLAEVAVPVEVLLQPVAKEAQSKGLETTVFMQRGLSADQKTKLLERFLQIYFPELLDQRTSKFYSVVVDFFIKSVVKAYEKGDLKALAMNLRSLNDARPITTIYNVSGGGSSQTYLTVPRFNDVRFVDRGGLTTLELVAAQDYFGFGASAQTGVFTRPILFSEDAQSQNLDALRRLLLEKE